MTGEKDATAEMPGVEEIARAVARNVDEERFADAPAFQSAARAILALFAPILGEKEREIEHFAALAFDDLGKNPPVAWRDRALAAEANFTTVAQENQDLIDKLDAAEAALAAERERVEQLHATIRKAHVAMTMACALPGVAAEYDFSEAIASTEATLARRAAAIRAEG